uniref:Uncharacterized protein n=1 Tax=Quercus lobata TaxID=97700 RepID=A0A7N2LHY1_QUELO
MTEEAGRDIGSKIGRVIEVDKRSWQADQAKFMRHDEKHCGLVMEKQPIEKQYGDWLRAGSISKGTNEGSRGSGSSSHETKNDGSRGSGSESHEPKNSGEAGKMSQAMVGEMVVSVQSRNERSSSLGRKVSLEGREKFNFWKRRDMKHG